MRDMRYGRFVSISDCPLVLLGVDFNRFDDSSSVLLTILLRATTASETISPPISRKSQQGMMECLLEFHIAKRKMSEFMEFGPASTRWQVIGIS